MERAVLEEINLARQNPGTYAKIVAASGHRDASAAREAERFLQKVRPLPPLRLSAAMTAGASSHAVTQGRAGALGHRGQDGSRPWDRLERWGEWGGSVGENIYYGRGSARSIVVNLIVDSGVRDRGHRKNIFNRSFAVAGIAHAPHSRYGALCVIDFAGSFQPLGAVGRSTGRRAVWQAEDPLSRR